jgi:hypothetical protein
MANKDITTTDIEKIYPTQNDISQTPYGGINSSELNFTNNIFSSGQRNFILPDMLGGLPIDTAGFVATAQTGTSLDVLITRGRAFISGRYVELKTGSSITVTTESDKDNYIYLQLQLTSSVVNTTPPLKFLCVAVAHGAPHTIPADAVPICFVETNATDIVTIQDMRPSRFSYPVSTSFGSFTTSVQSAVRRMYVPKFANKSVLCGYIDIDNNPQVQDLTITLHSEGRNFATSTVLALSSLGASDYRVRIKHAISPTIGFYEGGCADIWISATHQYLITNLNDTDTSYTWAWKEWNSLY